jgi:release factor glutamine methyltransferase
VTRPAEVVRRAAGYLERHDVPSPVSTAEVLLAGVLGTTRVGLYTRELGLTSAQARTFGRALCRRCTGTPLQHLTGEEGFRRLTLTVRPGVFIPRPETEIVVERGLAALRDVPSPVVVDVGTGSGAIALAVKDERPDALVWAIDLSPEAVALARENAERLGLSVEVLHGDLLDRLPEDLRGLVDLVIANPPYVEPREGAGLPPEVRADPPLALVGGVTVYRRLFEEAAAVLRLGGSVVVEIGETQGSAVAAAATAAGLADAEIVPDLTGRDRVVTARRP